jgi:hypothetical protein
VPFLLARSSIVTDSPTTMRVWCREIVGASIDDVVAAAPDDVLAGVQRDAGGRADQPRGGAVGRLGGGGVAKRPPADAIADAAPSDPRLGCP